MLDSFSVCALHTIWQKLRTEYWAREMRYWATHTQEHTPFIKSRCCTNCCASYTRVYLCGVHFTLLSFNCHHLSHVVAVLSLFFCVWRWRCVAVDVFCLASECVCLCVFMSSAGIIIKLHHCKWGESQSGFLRSLTYIRWLQWRSFGRFISSSHFQSSLLSIRFFAFFSVLPAP